MITQNTVLDITLLTYTAFLTYYTVYKRRNGLTHTIDKYFTAVLTPYILLISLTSATIATQQTVIKSFTLTATALTALTVTITRLKDQKKAYITETTIGLTALITLLAQVKPGLNTSILLQIIGLTTAAFLPVYILHFILEKKKIGLYLFPIYTHFLDAGSTVIALQKGLQESRILAQIFIRNMGEYGIFVMKALIIVPITLYIEKEIKGEISREILFMIGVYGLVLGLRNYFLMLS
jgi:hypothetical protein